MTNPSHRWTKRLLALGFGLAVVIILEGALRIAGVSDGATWSPPALVEVVENGQVSGIFQVRSEPHFIAEPLADGSEGFRTHPAHRMGKGGGFPLGGAMRDVHVAARPAPDTQRYVVLGGSAALGLKPVGPRAARALPTQKLPNGASVLPKELSISGSLESALRAGGVDAECIDGGMIAQDSRAVWRIAEEALALSPAGLVLYLGNNESLGMARALGDVEVPQMAVIRGALRHLRLYRLLAGMLMPRPETAAPRDDTRSRPSKRSRQGGSAGHEVLARVVGGQWVSAGAPLVDDAVATDDVSRAILRRFRDNITGIIEMASRKGVRVYILPTPPHLTYPPFSAAHDPGLPDSARAEAERARNAAEQALQAGNIDDAKRHAEDAVSIDPAHAGSWFTKGIALGRAGDHTAAVEALEYALARDISHKRTDPQFADIAATLCDDGALCRAGNAHQALSDLARTRGVGVYDEMLGDHEHLNPAGNRWAAELIAGLILDDQSAQ